MTLNNLNAHDALSNAIERLARRVKEKKTKEAEVFLFCFVMKHPIK